MRSREHSQFGGSLTSASPSRLELTYVDAQLRVGRDDKGFMFVMERAE